MNTDTKILNKILAKTKSNNIKVQYNTTSCIWFTLGNNFNIQKKSINEKILQIIIGQRSTRKEVH